MITLVIALIIYFAFYSLDLVSTLRLLPYLLILAPHGVNAEQNPHISDVLMEHRQMRGVTIQTIKIMLEYIVPGVLIYYLLSEMVGVAWIIFAAGSHYAAALLNFVQGYQLSHNPQIMVMIEKMKSRPSPIEPGVPLNAP